MDKTTAAEPLFKEGDDVSYMSTSSSRNTISFDTRYGKVIRMSEPGLQVLIKTRNNRKIWVATSDVRHLHAKSAVDAVFNAIVDAHKTNTHA